MLTADRSRKRVLGIAVGDRALLVAEVAGGGKAAQVLRVAEFSYPAGVTLDQPETLGPALHVFLLKGGFASRRVVFGIPAKWLILKPYTLPPADAETARTMLAIHAETHCPPELGEVVFDYAGSGNASDSSSILLMGLPRKCLVRLLALAQSARLKPIAITPCAAALGAATARRVESPLILSLRPEGAELAAQEGGQTRLIRHLGSAVSTSALTVELRRAAATLPNGWGLGNGNGRPHIGGARGIVLWDDVGLDPAALTAIEAALGMPIVRGDLSVIGGAGAGLSANRAGGAAVALAMPALAGKQPAVDFLHPRLAPPKAKRVSSRVFWSSAAAAVVLVVAAVAYGDLAILQRQIGKADADLKRLEPRVAVARPFVTSMRFADGFVETRPRHLACLRDVTTALPPDGQTYLTGFHLQTNMKGEITGRAGTTENVIKLADTLSAGHRFQDMKTRSDARESRTGGPGVSYTITFTYVPQS